jgi:hypothetical protein
VSRIETTVRHRFGPRTMWGLARLWLVFILLALPLRSPAVELMEIEAVRSDGGVHLDFGVRITLSRSVEDALQRGVPMYFVAQASLFRARWYWRDQRVARVNRSWRLTYQPLTSTWRVSQGALHQSFSSQAEALGAISRATHWKIAEAGQIEHDERYYLEFSYRLDTSQLPRPMQIGIGIGEADWSLGVERTVPLPALP